MTAEGDRERLARTLLRLLARALPDGTLVELRLAAEGGERGRHRRPDGDRAARPGRREPAPLAPHPDQPRRGVSAGGSGHRRATWMPPLRPARVSPWGGSAGPIGAGSCAGCCACGPGPPPRQRCTACHTCMVPATRRRGTSPRSASTTTWATTSSRSGSTVASSTRCAYFDDATQRPRAGPRRRAGGEARPRSAASSTSARPAAARHRLRLGRAGAVRRRALRRASRGDDALASARPMRRTARRPAGPRPSACGSRSATTAISRRWVTFDAVASIGMFEHVGRGTPGPLLRGGFGALAPGGLFLNHGIATTEAGGRRTPASSAARGARLRRALRLPRRRARPGPSDARLRPRRRLRAPRRPVTAPALRAHAAGLGSPARGHVDRGATPRAEEVYRTWRLYMAAPAGLRARRPRRRPAAACSTCRPTNPPRCRCRPWW